MQHVINDGPALLPARWTSRFNRPVNRSSGLLFGVRQSDEVRVLLAQGGVTAACPSDLDLLGIFVCRARGEVFLTDDDLAQFEKHQGVLALVVAGESAGFFVREPDGSVQAIRSHEEFPVSEILSQRRISRAIAKPAAAKLAATAEQPAPAPGPLQSWKRLAACIALLAVPAGAFALLRPLVHLPLALALREESGQLVIGWNPSALTDGSRLEIRDGSARTIVMLTPHTSSATYGPQGSDVEVRLSTDSRVGGAHWEAARFLTRAVHRPAPVSSDVQNRITSLTREAQQLRRTLLTRQARMQALAARMDEMVRPEP
ncbi:MAG TPA: hypothetical protein VGJ09_13765 [Bryobacteraceae bacterium]